MIEFKVVEKLDKVTVQRVLAGELTMSEFKAFEPLIDSRMNYIVRQIASISNLKLDWWDFDNLGEGEDEPGRFDFDKYYKSVGIVSESIGESYKKMCFEKYKESIPVQFLWMDFEAQVAKEFEDFKSHIDANAIHAANKAVEAKQKFDSIIASVKAKLTPEELTYIEFRSPKRSDKRRNK